MSRSTPGILYLKTQSALGTLYLSTQSARGNSYNFIWVPRVGSRHSNKECLDCSGFSNIEYPEHSRKSNQELQHKNEGHILLLHSGLSYKAISNTVCCGTTFNIPYGFFNCMRHFFLTLRLFCLPDKRIFFHKIFFVIHTA